jgi:type I restriction enzyme, S subunit
LLCHALNHVDYRGFANGTTRLKLTQAAMLQIPLTLPPRDEQRRIVEALEAHLSRLDAGLAGAEAAKRRLLSLRRRFVIDAVDHRDALRVPLGDIAEKIKNGVFVSRAGAEIDGVPILRIGAVRPFHLSLDDLRFSAMSRETVAAQGFLLGPGDLLFTRYNGNPDYVGACAVVPSEIGDLTYPDKLIRVVLDRAQAEPDYVAAYCSVGNGRRAIESALRTTAGQVGIAGRDLKEIPIDLPSLEIQLTSVGRMRDQLSASDRLLSQFEGALSRAAALRRSLLTSAFSGQLVAQDPNDEPAELLLKRIQAERATEAPRTRRTRKAKATP